ncbi:MAG: SGNH/GDSL hydrolase family protein [Pseudonocardiaceae bacterium]
MPVYRRVIPAAIAALLALVGLPASAGAAPSDRPPERYVALGDSYAAGPGIPEQRANPRGCNRSSNNYPARLAAGLGLRNYTDVSCSSAKTDNMTAAQSVSGGSNPPQFTALRPDTDLVTLTISGNDIGFTEIVFTCARVSVRDPMGNPCEREFTAGGNDIYAQRIEAVAPKVGKVLEGIRQRSPKATVLLVGYLRILPPSNGCYPVFPVARGDVPYLDGLQRQLTAMLAGQAFQHGAAFVDPYAGSTGHDACKGPSERWVEGVVPSNRAAPVHPNATGMQAVAGFALASLRELTNASAAVP